jgi:DNA-binding CsgD family transcriptional regulator
MRESERSPVFGGLVSPAAESLYLRLRAAGSMRGDDFDRNNPEAGQLLELGLAFRSGEHDELVRAVEPAVALRLLLEIRQRELMSAQRHILDGWAKLAGMLPSAFDGRSAEGTDGVRLLTSLEEVVTRAAELYPSPKRRLRGTETGVFVTRPTEHRLRVPPFAAVRAGVRFQMIYQADYLSTPAGSKIIDSSARSGEQVRLRAKMPIKMLHVDDSVALVGLDRSARTALLVWAPAILAQLAEWFDLLWDEPATICYPVGGADPLLTEQQIQVLKLMPTGDDDAIARKLGVSVTTVRRHVKAIYQALGVNSRFAAGMAAAKRNWI